MKLRLLLVALCAVLATFLSGCSSPDSPAPKPTESAIPSQSQAPEMPTLAREHSEAGAEAFVQHFIDVLNTSQWEGETQYFLDLSSPMCSNCSSMASAIQEIKEAGGSFEGGLLVVHKFTADLDEEQTTVTIDCEFTKGSVILEKSAKAKELPPSRKELHFILSFQPEQQTWIVEEIATELT